MSKPCGFGMIQISQKVNISVFAVIAFILFCLSQGIIYSLLFFSAVIIHELSHIVFLVRFKVPIIGISVYPFGIDIKADTLRLSYKKELVVTLAGCLSNLLCALTGFVIFHFISTPYILFFIMCHSALGFFNLIPVSFFDGGRALRLLLYDSFEIDTAFCLQRICDIFSCLVFLLAGMFLIVFSHINLSVVALSIYSAATVLYMHLTKRSRHVSAP